MRNSGEVVVKLQNLSLNECKITPISLSHVSLRYLSWMQDPEVLNYIESGHAENLDQIRNYVASAINDQECNMYAFTLVEKNLHIGNGKICPINNRHRRAAISYMIGEKEYWGQGFGTRLVALLVEEAKRLGLERLDAGCFEANIGSRRILENNGFQLEGVFRDHAIHNERRTNTVVYGKIL